MTTKKRPTKKSVGKGGSSPKNGKSKQIGGAMLLKYKAAVAEYSERSAKLQECKLRLELEKKKPEHAPLVVLLNECQQLLKEYQEKGKALNDMLDKIAIKLGAENVKEFLETHTIDTDTGVVRRSPASPD